jgi:hypothetical protein
MKKSEFDSDDAKQQLLRDILVGKKIVVKKHISRTGAKFRNVEGYVRNGPDVNKELKKLITSTKPEFDTTPLGYKRAVIWLRATKQYHLIENERSIDGYSVVNLANKLYEKTNKE